MTSTQLDSPPEAVIGQEGRASAKSVDVEGVIRGDQFLAEAAAELGEQLMCKRCGLFHALDDSVVKSTHIVVCRRCHSAYTMLVRNMSWPPPDFCSMPLEDQESFWRNCKEELKPEANGRLKYSTLRALLVRTLVQRKTHITKAEEATTPMPLEAWKRAGWDADHIEKHGRKVWCESAGWLYEVCVVNKSKAVVLEEIESRLTKSEQQVREKKGAVTDEAVGLDVASGTDTEVEPKAKKPKTVKPGKEEAAAKRKQEADDRKHNTKTQAMATKVIGYLVKTVGDMKAAKDLAEKSRDSLPGNVVDDILEKATEVIEMHAAANNVLKAVASCAAKKTRLPDLDFDTKQMVKLSGQAKASLRTFNSVCKALKIS